MKKLILIAVFVGILGAVIGRWLTASHPTQVLSQQTALMVEADRFSVQSSLRPEPLLEFADVVESPAPSESDLAAKAESDTTAAPRKPAAPSAVPPDPTPPGSGRPSGKEPPRDPVARVALMFVGYDPDAEAYWYEAINDPSLPATERQDLIEDLNEDGLPDPKHPTAEDLPLIMSRLMILEAVGPEAMDEVNLEAFLEAYKDLVNLANVAMGGGQPVR